MYNVTFKHGIVYGRTDKHIKTDDPYTYIIQETTYVPTYYIQAVRQAFDIFSEANSPSTA